MYYNKNITIETLKKQKVEPAIKYDVAVLKKLFADSSPLVRGYAFNILQSYRAYTNEIVDIAKEAFKNEKDVFVLHRGIHALSNLKHHTKPDDSEIAQLILREAKSDNALIRNQVAIYLGRIWFKDSKEAVDTELMLIDDKVPLVAHSACSNSGHLNNERILAKVAEIMKDDSKEDLQENCAIGLIRSWWNENTNETAYKMTMDYFKKTPRKRDTPYWFTISTMNLSESTVANNLKAAPYFNKGEFISAMKEIIKDENSSLLTRKTAITSIAIYGTKAELVALGPVIKKLKDRDSKYMEEAYTEELKKKN